MQELENQAENDGSDSSTIAPSKIRAVAVRMLVPLYLILLAAIPTLCVGGLISLSRSTGFEWVAVATCPAVAVVTFSLACGLLAFPTRSAIVRGRFPRDLGHRIYGPRRLYALCWSALYYCGPVYHAVLAVPLLKRLVFRLFGYKGSLAVQIYPDTWLRDLPLLELEEGAYLSNKATIGTNMCLTNGDVIVEPVRVGRSAMIGHMVMLGPGCQIGEGAEVGVGAGVGIHARVGSYAKIGPCAIINHGARIGGGAQIGLGAVVGHRAIVGEGVVVPSGAVVPDRARLYRTK